MMGVAFRPFCAGDVVQLALQPSQHVELGRAEPLDYARGRQLADGGPGWTAIAGDGRFLVCAGFYEQFDGASATAWALLAADLGAAHLAITRFARRAIARAAEHYHRVESIVHADNAPGIAWARLVGFRAAARLEGYGYAGEPHILFERVRHGG